MAATGNVTEDLPVIKEILDRTGGPKHLWREPWWGSPCSEESIEALADEYGELPQDVIDFYRVTNIATFGRFDEIVGPLELFASAGYPLPYSQEDYDEFPELFQEGVPQGNAILPMSIRKNQGCLIEIGGADHGRVINPQPDINYFRTLAWSLSDAVACTRDLYEFGWYQRDGHPFGGSKISEAGIAELAKVQPIIDKWNCNPVIAMFHDPYGYEPERPTNRKPN